MRNNQQGFTLIELIVVIVILGILAATALPKFIDVSADARNAAASGVAASIASGSAINYAAKKAGNVSGVAVSAATSCTPTILQPFVTGVTLSGTTASTATDGAFAVLAAPAGDCSGASADGTAVSCSIQADGPGTKAITASVICAK